MLCPKDERRQIMKKIIALLLALAMIFAFAACKGKDDNKDTTADSTQGARMFRTPRQAARIPPQPKLPRATAPRLPPRAAARRPPRVSRAALRAAPTSTLPSTARRTT